MSKLQKWLKGQKSTKKESKGKDDKANSKQTPVVQTPPHPQPAASPNRDAKASRPTLRHRILAAGLHTKTSTSAKTSGLQDIITVIPEGRKEIHISVSELRKPTTNTTDTKPASNRLQNDILASMSRANKQIPSTPVPKSEPAKQAIPVSTTQRESVPSPSKARESTPTPVAVAPSPPPDAILRDDRPAPNIKKDENAKTLWHDEAEKPTTQPPTNVTRQVSEEVKKYVPREPVPPASPSVQGPKPVKDPTTIPVTKTSPKLGPISTTQKQPEVAKPSSNEPNKAPRASNSTGTSPNPTEAAENSLFNLIQGTPIFKTPTPSSREKKAMNTSYHYSKTFPPPNPTGALHNPEALQSPVSTQVFERIHIPQGLLSTPRTVRCRLDPGTNNVTPLNKAAFTPKPKPQKEAYIFKLSPELLLQIASHLPYPATAYLKLTCLPLNRLIPLTLKPTPVEKLSVVQAVRPRQDFKNDRNPPYLCRDCIMWHSFEHMIIWPHPRPENVFLNYADFKLQRPRTCVRYKVKSGEWVIGRRIGGEHLLCGKCVTPTARGECAWNCGRCGRCTGRKAWSGFCEGCWRVGDGEEIRNGSSDQAAAWEYVAGARLTKLGKEKKKRKICGRCLGVLDFEPGSREVCRCGESHRATY